MGKIMKLVKHIGTTLLAVSSHACTGTAGSGTIPRQTVSTRTKQCAETAPQETFSKSDAPKSINVSESTNPFYTPWGYHRKENASRKYPIVVNGCWGEGWAFEESVRQKYPAFYLEYQRCDRDDDGARLADILDAAVKSGLRIDMNRVYLTGFSKGGSGSYKLVRGFLSRGKYFAAIIRIAGQSETVLPDDVVQKTAIWYHVGYKDMPIRVRVAKDAFDFVKKHPANKTATESIFVDDLTGLERTTRTLTRDGIEFMKLSEYPKMGHKADAPYRDAGLFTWLFAQSLR